MPSGMNAPRQSAGPGQNIRSDLPTVFMQARSSMCVIINPPFYIIDERRQMMDECPCMLGTQTRRHSLVLEQDLCVSN